MLNEPQYKQVETIQLAPDALLFINGSDVVVDDNGNTFEIRNDIVDCSVDLGVDSVPGTATFSINIPDHSIRRFGDTRYDSLKVMSEVEIYYRGRFPKVNSDGIKIYPYYPAFWGLIISITENYSDGMHTLSVSCTDILRWWEITTINVNPSMVAALQSDILSQLKVSSTDVQKFTEESFNQNKVLVDSTIGNADELVKQINLSIFENKFADKNIGEILIELSQISTDELNPIQKGFEEIYALADKITTNLKEIASGELDLMIYWNERFKQIGRRLRIYGIENIHTDINGDIRFDFIQEELIKVKPYPMNVKTPDKFESDFQSKLDIANNLKDIIQFEFFMDVTGEIIFKPPFYNMDTRQFPAYVIQDVDIIDWNFNCNESEVITRVDVTGQWNPSIAGGDVVIRGTWVDFNLAKKYGFRATQRHCSWLNEPKECLLYAAGEGARLNALARQGSITIIGRPELRLGYPIYIPSRDAFYYIKGISHNFSFGSSFTTTLQLVAERRRKYDANGNLIKWEIFRNVDQVESDRKIINGNSVANQAKDNNYIKQLYNPCQFNSMPQVIVPHFIENRENIGSTQMGDWKSITNFRLNDDADFTKAYQITDGNGYELISPFLFGRNFVLTDVSKIDESREINLGDTLFLDTNQVPAESDVDATAKFKQKMKEFNDKAPDYKLAINPNNIALTLDNSDASMLSIYDKTRKSQAKVAMTLNPDRNKQK